MVALTCVKLIAVTITQSPVPEVTPADVLYHSAPLSVSTQCDYCKREVKSSAPVYRYLNMA
jgi:hypothetical protein